MILKTKVPVLSRNREIFPEIIEDKPSGKVTDFWYKQYLGYYHYESGFLNVPSPILITLFEEIEVIDMKSLRDENLATPVVRCRPV